MKRNKYNARKIERDGMIFDSRKEMARYYELKILEKKGLIKDLKRQVKYQLIPSQKKSDGKCEKPTFYVADFVYTDLSGRYAHEVVEDVKGYKKGAGYQLFVIKRKLMLEKYGIEVKEF